MEEDLSMIMEEENISRRMNDKNGEKLSLICRKCGKGWEEIRPEGYLVRYDKRGVFLVNRKPPRDKKFFKCPDCKNTRDIGRLAVEKIRIPLSARKGGPS